MRSRKEELNFFEKCERLSQINELVERYQQENKETVNLIQMMNRVYNDKRPRSKRDVCKELYKTVSNYENVKFETVYCRCYWDGNLLRYSGHHNYSCPELAGIE